MRRQPPATWHTVTPLPGSRQRREQQFESEVQGTPPWPQFPAAPPEGSTQRPGAPPVALHRPEQHSTPAKQMSPGAWHAYAGTQVPPWQFVEQHAEFEAHASPRTLHVALPGTGAHVPPVHVCEQQSAFPVHATDVALQAVAADAQVPPVQVSEQHSPAVVHAPPVPTQKASEVHAPFAHFAEQHSAFDAHAALSALQAGTAHWWLDGLQYPEQQSTSRVQDPAPFPTHELGATQSPFWHWSAVGVWQQSPLAVQESPCAEHVGGGGRQKPPWHVFAPQQADPPTVHAPPCWTQAGGGARHTPDWQVFGLQHVVPPVHAPFSAAHGGGGGLELPPELQATASANTSHSERNTRSMGLPPAPDATTPGAHGKRASRPPM